MTKLKLALVIMVAAIGIIAAFQTYWLTQLYQAQQSDVAKRADVLFRDVMYKLQLERIKEDTLIYNATGGNNLFIADVLSVVKKMKKDSTATPAQPFMNITIKKDSSHQNQPFKPRIIFNRSITTDSSGQASTVIIRGPEDQDYTARKNMIDSLMMAEKITPKFAIPIPEPKPTVKKKTPRQLTQSFIYRAFTDSLPIRKIDSAYKAVLKKEQITIPFAIVQVAADTTADSSNYHFSTGKVAVGIGSNKAYKAGFNNPIRFVLGRIVPQVALSILMLLFIVAAFVFLYRNLRAQQRLADMKNEFISNITHELKTPIATVNVAVEAMRNFNALNDPAKTKEYLDISAAELQRLSLLVDKVLKLSMFEKQEVDVKKEWFNLHELVQEVANSLKLQFDKHKAKVTIQTTGTHFDMQADRLHITSVIYNLLDNALKYSNKHPVIDVVISDEGDKLVLSVADNGMGIAPAFKAKIFDKFFRVPTQNRHDIKGYGLGLSYVAHIVQQHQGTIQVESELGTGSRFIIQLPK